MPIPLAPIHGTPYIGGQTPALLYVTADGLQNAVKVNLAATVAPGVGDDSADGYSSGSLWLDTVGGILYVCESASAGAAVWRSRAGRKLPT